MNTETAMDIETMANKLKELSKLLVEMTKETDFKRFMEMQKQFDERLVLCKKTKENLKDKLNGVS